MNEQTASLPKKIGKTLAAAAFWLAVWCLFAYVIRLDLLLPSPGAVLAALKELVGQKEFFASCGRSLLRVLEAWTAGLAAGLAAGILTKLSPAAQTLLSPALHIVKATPVASFIVLALVLMKTNRVPVFTGALIVIPIVWANTVKGLGSVDGKLAEMAKAFGMKKSAKIRYLFVPALLPYFSSAATTAMGLAWKACIAAEVICTPSGSIGAGIQNAKIYLETPSLFAWTLTVILLSVLLEKLIQTILAKAVKL